MKKTVAVDVDGVLAQYDGWKGVDHIGDPIDGARYFLSELQKHFHVLIFTTRTNPFNADNPSCEWKVKELRTNVRDWLDRHELPYDDIYQGVGKPLAFAIIDDRGVSCRPQDHPDGAGVSFMQTLMYVKALAGK